MLKQSAAAATPAASADALACCNTTCGKALSPPLLWCSKCKREAYCCKACQVPPPPRTRSAQREVRALTRPTQGVPGETRLSRARTARRTRTHVCSVPHPRPLLRFPLPAPHRRRSPRGGPGTRTSAARQGRARRRRRSGAPRGGGSARRDARCLSRERARAQSPHADRRRS